MDQLNSLSIKSLTLNREKLCVFKNLGFTTQCRRVRIAGSNGTGKTTLLLVIAGLLPAHLGTIELLGEKKPADRRRCCGVFSSSLATPEYLSVDQILSFLGRKSKEYLCSFELNFLKGVHSSEKYHNLSEGQKCKVSIVCALRKERGALLMDEPFNALDVTSRKLLSDYLLSYRGLLIYVDHRNTSALMEEALLKL